MFVDAFQSIDTAIVHPGFMLVFAGALILSAAATLLHLRHDGRSVLPWAAVATVLYLGAFIITVGVHVPLNDQIKAAGDPGLIRDLASVRERFQEDRWVTWNVVRAVLATCASVLLASALTQRRRRDHRQDRGVGANERRPCGNRAPQGRPTRPGSPAPQAFGR